MENIILTGDRPTGRLHIGHYVGSLKQRLLLQNEGNYDEMLIMIADAQALTDNFGNPQKVRNNILEVMIDYLSIGLDPNKVTMFVQSSVRALPELTMYYMNLVTLPRVLRNPTIKSEIKLRGFDDNNGGIPVGFANYPISQASDITAFKANIVPVGDDQLPMIEQAREIVTSFNKIYGEVLVEPTAKLPNNKVCLRLPGLDGKEKMSKSLGNTIYLADDSKTLKDKIKTMYTDPLHIKVSDPGHVDGNTVFTYLDAFATTDDFKKYLSDYKDLDDLKEKYQHGGVGDSVIKNFLFNVLDNLLAPIREKRAYYEQNIPLVVKYLEEGSKKANILADKTLDEVRKHMGLNYFNETFIKEQTILFANKNKTSN